MDDNTTAYSKGASSSGVSRPSVYRTAGTVSLVLAAAVLLLVLLLPRDDEPLARIGNTCPSYG